MKITKRPHAFKGFASSYNVKVLNSFNYELQLVDIEPATKSNPIHLLFQLKDFKFVTTLVLVFKYIESEDKTKYDISYSNSNAEIVINESDNDDVFQSIYLTYKYLGKGSH